MPRLFKRPLLTLSSCAVAAYVATYLWLSLHGRYEANVIGSGGVKWYMWAPKGFVTDFRWNKTLKRVFSPLLFLDTKLWHTWEKAEDDDSSYPVNEVSAEDIWKVYEAWDADD